MGEKKFRASLSKGRIGWCVIFPHPLKTAKDGQPGLRVRKGLGTSDKDQAQALVDQLNQLLGDQSYWNPTERQRAGRVFSDKVIAAFYDETLPEERDAWSARNKVLPLPTKDDGYARVMFVGTTGAGKTTIVRQLIGTDPQKERFPSISAAKTTISDLEIFTTDEPPYRAVVSFFDRSYVRRLIEECVLAAVVAHTDGGGRSEVEGKLLVHSEQRFRLSYLLGTSKTLAPLEEDEITDDEGSEEFEGDDDEKLSDDDRTGLYDSLMIYLDGIESLGETSNKMRENMAEEVGISLSSATKDDLDAIQELLEDELYKRDEFQILVDDIFDDAESRFQLLEGTALTRDRSHWPFYWTFESLDRKEFIRTINRFSSNFAPHFGRLLTPLVEGIRVSGPFSPAWDGGGIPRFVLMDGEGLGHTPESAASVSTRVTRRFQDSDTIILVDNAAQPMLAAPTAVLERLVSSGHHTKLIVCFTHFDEVKGVNLLNVAMRKDHILNSFDNSVKSIGRSLGLRAERVLSDCKSSRVFFLSKIQETVQPNQRNLSYNELTRLIRAIQDSIRPPVPVEVTPIYDDSSLVLNIQRATQEFHMPWEARLNLRYDPRVKAEHWARIKALTRRLGELNIDEYDTLRPVADLITRLQVHLYLFIENPITWKPETAPDEMKQAAIDQTTRKLDETLYHFISHRMFKDKAKEWYYAYSHRGIGSTRVRANEVRDIYAEAAPIPGEVPNTESNKFLREIRLLVRKAILESGGRFRLEPEVN